MNTSTEWQQYREMRETGNQLRAEMMGLLPMNFLEKCAHDLGFMREGKIQVQNYLQLFQLEDYALFNYGPTGIVALEKYQQIRQASFTPVQAQFMEALLKSRYSVFHVTNCVPNLGVNVRDLLYGDTLFIVDERFQQGQAEGALFGCRPLVFPQFAMMLGSMQTLSNQFIEQLPYHAQEVAKLQDRSLVKAFERQLLFSMLYDSLQSELDTFES